MRHAIIKKHLSCHRIHTEAQTQTPMILISQNLFSPSLSNSLKALSISLFDMDPLWSTSILEKIRFITSTLAISGLIYALLVWSTPLKYFTQTASRSTKYIYIYRYTSIYSMQCSLLESSIAGSYRLRPRFDSTSDGRELSISRVGITFNRVKEYTAIATY